MELSKSSANWDETIDAAIKDGTAAVLFAGALDIAPDSMPPEAMKRLKEHYIATLVTNSRMMADLAAVAESLREGGVEAIVIKGMALLADVYRDVAERPTSDADILIRLRDFEKARSILLQQGFVCNPLTDRSAFANELAFEKKDTAVVELRWSMRHHDRFRFLDRFAIDEIFASAAGAEINGAGIRIPSPEYQLLIAVYHLSFAHRFEKKMWLRDIAAIAERYGDKIDWRRVPALSKSCGMRNALAYSFYRAHLEFGFEAPVDIKISKLRTRLLDACVCRRYVYPLDLLLMDGLKDMILYLAGILWPSDGWLKNHYRTSFPKPYRVLHPFLIVAAAAGKILAAAFRPLSRFLDGREKRIGISL